MDNDKERWKELLKGFGIKDLTDDEAESYLVQMAKEILLNDSPYEELEEKEKSIYNFIESLDEGDYYYNIARSALDDVLKELFMNSKTQPAAPTAAGPAPAAAEEEAGGEGLPFTLLGKAKFLFLNKTERHLMTQMDDCYVFIKGVNLHFGVSDATNSDLLLSDLWVPLKNIHTPMKQKSKGSLGTDGQITIYFEPPIDVKNKVIIQPFAKDESYRAQFFAGDNGATRDAMAEAIKSAVKSVTGMDFDSRTEAQIRQENGLAGGGKKSRRRKTSKRRKYNKRKSTKRRYTKRRKSKTRRRRR